MGIKNQFKQITGNNSSDVTSNITKNIIKNSIQNKSYIEEDSNFRSRFESIGIYLPEKVVTTKDLVNQMETKPLFNLQRLTGIKERRFRSESESSYTMAIAAAKECLKNSKYEAKDLDIIICTSITRYKKYPVWEFEPALSLYIKKEIGANSAITFDISNACAGMLTGAYILNNMIETGLVSNGMIVSGECITPLSETAIKEISKPIDEQFASLTVGDSGAAFILDVSPSKNEGIELVDFISIARYANLCYAMPSDKNAGAAMYTKASRIHKESIKRVPLAIKEIFNKAKEEFEPDDYDYIIAHQTSKRAINQGIKELELYYQRKMPEPLFSLQKYGNTSTTTHLIVLDKSLKEKIIKKGSKILFISLASGIIFGYLSATIGELRI